MKKIVIVQPLPLWMGIIKSAIKSEFPEGIIPNVEIEYTNSFDHCLSLIPKTGNVLVLSTTTFHDDCSEHRGNVVLKIDDHLKNGDTLAKMVKEINSKSKVWIFSRIPPQSIVHIDGFISKKDRNGDSLFKLMNLIKQD
jgi:hypothetical protein